MNADESIILSTAPKDFHEILRQIADDPAARRYACQKSDALFSLYYFPHYHFFEMPGFHRDMYRDLGFQDITGVLWEMYRESAKTSIAKIGLVKKICYAEKHFIPWVSYDQKKAAANLYDVALALQMNKRILEDFGQLFYESDMEIDEDRKKFSKKKSVSEFITVNKIKVKAYSTGTSIRGEVYDNYRPDWIILDDIENIKTVVSEAMTNEVIAFIDEMLSGAASDANYLILANCLSFSGSIAYLKNKIKDEKDWVLRNVKVVDDNDNLTWPAKYVKTDKEAEIVNLGILDKKQQKVSLEKKQRLLGYTTYNREMLNTPLTDEEREIKLSWLQYEFTDDEIKDRTRNRYVTIDVADSKARGKNDPDDTGTTVVDIDSEGNWYVQAVNASKFNAPELIDWIFYIWETYKPIKIGVEKKSLEDQVMPYIKQRSAEKQIFPVVVELKSGGTNKQDRIRGALQGRLQHGKIKFRKGAMDDTPKLKAQLFDFPKGRHDDLPDALHYISQIGGRPFSQGPGENNSLLNKEFYAHKKKEKALQSARARILNL